MNEYNMHLFSNYASVFFFFFKKNNKFLKGGKQGRAGSSSPGG